ncbi:hypothetical protein BK816_06335 [Boudabousia tangfeifanii]|uniref:Bax inhibitor-1/YccA family protein n=1 Tax=Boudabousia tangfeifanii TaxID=1912795 RepID=A0A1D9MKZ5_9ACTO|nr:Bax inhibitor-1/YccA family protein [Boudabousia tangfeifanii]AOZ72955.1 hypothetical protein BK816_06335 [Boudabousia tangfeifanii]
MSNPVFSNMTELKTPAGYPTMPGYTPGQGTQSRSNAGTMPQPQVVPPVQYDPLESQYAGPAATNSEMGRVTYDSVLMKSLFLFALAIAAGVGEWLLFSWSGQNIATTVGFGATFAGFILAMINIFKKSISPTLISLYAICEGASLAFFSMLFETMVPGVVFQAVIASLIVFAVSLGLFASGKVRNSTRLAKFTLMGVLSLLLLQVADFFLVRFGVINNPWGLEGGTIFGIPVAGLLALLVVFLGVSSLIGDFDSIKLAVERGLPDVVGWKLAFGLMVTLVWLYTQLLRYLAILNDRN